MAVIKSLFEKSSLESKENEHYHLSLKNDLLGLVKKIENGGGEKAQLKQKEKKKFATRERIKKILDQGSSFLEIGKFAGYDLYSNEDIPAAGIVVGIGKIQNIECMIVANDPTVKGGTYYPITVKKHLRAQEIALENHLPCIYIVDSGGAFLSKQDEVFPDKEHFGRIFYNQAIMSSKGIPQVALVCGSCTAGGAYVPAMCDETIIVKGNGTIFLGGPPLVKAAIGEDVTAEDLGGGFVHTTISGVADHLAEDEEHGIEILRDIVFYFNKKKYGLNALSSAVVPPLYEAQDIYSILPKDTSRTPFDIREILARLLDGSDLHEFKARFGKTIICGFGKIHGFEVGIVANNGVLFSESALKAAHFVQLCGERKIPLVFLQNITGFMVGKKVENEGIAKHGAKLVTAVSTVAVPKFTVIVGGSFGAGNYGMCGRAFGARFLWMWPNAKISVMGGEQAASVLWRLKEDQAKNQGLSLTVEQEDEFKKPIREKYLREGSALYSSARLWDDGIIDPVDTRNILGLALTISRHLPIENSKYGIFRM